LTGAQERQLTRRATDNPQAYQLYLAGIFHSRKGNLEGCKKALDYLNQAVVLDPNFALAYSGMPAVYSNLSDMRGLNPGEAIERGRAAAQKALELDGTLAEAHNGLAVIKRQEWDWSGAESEYKRAIELNPNHAEAINEFQKANSLYGVAPNGLIDLGYVYAISGKRDEALAILNKLKTSKEYVSPTGLALLYAGLGDKEAAFQWLERAYAAHDSQLQYLKVDPRYDSLRSDPKFADLLRRMKLAS